MANEAVCIETPTIFRRRTVADGTGIAIGTIMKLTDPNTVEASSASNDPFGGIAWEEKTASDGITEIVVAMNGVWDMKATTAAIGIGVPCAIGGANLIRAAIEADTVLGDILGRAEETFGNDEVGRVSVGGFF